MYVLVETFDGPGVVAWGRCAVCGWAGLDTWTVPVRVGPRGADGLLSVEVEAGAPCACPRCGLHEAHVELSGPDDQGGASAASGPAPR